MTESNYTLAIRVTAATKLALERPPRPAARASPNSLRPPWPTCWPTLATSRTAPRLCRSGSQFRSMAHAARWRATFAFPVLGYLG